MNNVKIKATVYTSLVRPSFEYACAVWDPYHQNNNHTCAHETVQGRAARFEKRHHNTLFVSSMIEKLDWNSLDDWWKISRLTNMYKVTDETLYWKLISADISGTNGSVTLMTLV